MCAFCTCVNIGDIVGAQIGQGLLSAFDKKWQWLFVILTVLYILIAIGIALLLVQHLDAINMVVEPEQIFIKVQEKVERQNPVAASQEDFDDSDHDIDDNDLGS